VNAENRRPQAPAPDSIDATNVPFIVRQAYDCLPAAADKEARRRRRRAALRLPPLPDGRHDPDVVVPSDRSTCYGCGALTIVQREWLSNNGGCRCARDAEAAVGPGLDLAATA
jgi:hypothetical protein